MMRRILIVLGAAALLVVLGSTDARAGRYRAVRSRVSWTSYHPASYRVSRSVVRPWAYPRVRQIDGKTLWDLGKQKGAWPTLP